MGRIIILSGYSDFEYAKKAIKFGVDEYLLKPVDEKELVEAVVSVTKKMEDESVANIYSGQNYKKARDNFVYDLISGKALPALSDVDLKSAGLLSNMYQIIVIVYRDYHLAERDLPFWQGHKNKTLDMFPVEEKIILFVRGHKHISDFQAELVEIVGRNADIAAAAVSCPAHHYLSVPDLYKQACYCIGRLFFCQNKSRVIFFSAIAEEKNAVERERLDLFAFSDRVCAYVIYRQVNDLEKSFHELELYFRHSEYSSEQVVGILINLYMLLINTVTRLYPDIKSLPSHETVIHAISERATLSEILAYITDRLMVLSDEIYQSNDIVKNVCSYIDRHYQQPLTLSGIASMFKYNSSYLGRVFNRQTKESFHTYLDRIRIEKSKEFLRNNDEKIKLVSEKVGISNTDYFCKKFKQYVGITPSEYRKALSRPLADKADSE